MKMLILNKYGRFSHHKGFYVPLDKNTYKKMSFAERQNFRRRYLNSILWKLAHEQHAEAITYLEGKDVIDGTFTSAPRAASYVLWFLLFRYVKTFMSAAEDIYVRKLCTKTQGNKAEEVYPWVVVGCELGWHKACGRTRADIKSLNPILAHKLYAITGRKPIQAFENQLGNLVFDGTCAEDHAAHQILENRGFADFSTLKQMKFTYAFRPRTLEYMPPCDTCKRVFKL